MNGGLPIPIIEYGLDVIILKSGAKKMKLANVLTMCGLTKSNSESLQMINQGAVKIDGEPISENVMVDLNSRSYVFQVGERRCMKVVSY